MRICVALPLNHFCLTRPVGHGSLLEYLPLAFRMMDYVTDLRSLTQGWRESKTDSDCSFRKSSLKDDAQKEQMNADCGGRDRVSEAPCLPIPLRLGKRSFEKISH